MISIYLKIAGMALIAALLSAAFNFLLIRFSNRLTLTELPRKDRWHRNPTPNSGGLALFLSCALVYGAALRGVHRSVAIGAAAICLLGFLDDRIQLRPGLKFSLQCLIAVLVVLNRVVFPASPWYALNLVISILWIVAITNAFNLIDNMDGLCAGVAIIICVFRFSLLAVDRYWNDAAMCAVIGAALAGFLPFNYRPAKIFMGDCGSMFAGFSLAALAIASPLPHTKIFLAGFFYPALTFTYPIFDTVFVSILRKAAGRKISVGGRDHSSHRLASLGMAEERVVWILWALTALCSAVGLMTRWMPIPVIAAIAFLVGSLAMFGMFLSTLPPYQFPAEPALLPSSFLRRHVPSLRAGLILLVDAFVAGVSLFVAFLIRYESELPPVQIHNLLVSMPVVMACHGLVSCIERTFNVPWRWFSLDDVLGLARAVVLGAASSFFLLWLFGIRSYPRSAMILYCVLCLGFSLTLRVSLRMLQGLLTLPNSASQRVAIYGANSHGEMAATLLQRNEELETVPVVFLDHDRSKHGMRIRGIPIRCYDLTNMEALAAEFHLHAVLMPGFESCNGHQQLENDCRKAGLQLCALEIAIREVTPVPEQACSAQA